MTSAADRIAGRAETTDHVVFLATMNVAMGTPVHNDLEIVCYQRGHAPSTDGRWVLGYSLALFVRSGGELRDRLTTTVAMSLSLLDADNRESSLLERVAALHLLIALGRERVGIFWEVAVERVRELKRRAAKTESVRKEQRPVNPGYSRTGVTQLFDRILDMKSV